MNMAKHQGRSRAPADDAGAAVFAALRRQAIRGTLGAAAISFACNIGSLAVPLYNMEIFNRVMPTRNMHTLFGLTVAVLICALCYVVLDYLRTCAMAALADRFARGTSPALLQAASIAGARAVNPMQSLRDVETLRQFIASPSLTAPFDLAWSPVLLVVLFAMGWGYAVLAAVFIVLLAGLNLLGDAVARRPPLGTLPE
jgi:ABC-type protease/lipase transport system fused ATPase/permease subunit